MMIFLSIVLGLIIGMIWYRYGERFDQKKLEPKCWELLHYYNKEKSPLYIVHLKSILAGILLIVLAYSNWKGKSFVIALIGSAIIGLHIYQWYNETCMIKRNGELFSKNFI